MNAFKNFILAVLIGGFIIILSCDDDDNGSTGGGNMPLAKIPPSGWTQKVNNRLIGRVTTTGGFTRNCASTVGRNIECPTPTVFDSIPEKCYLFVTYLDETPREKWQKDCDNGTLMYDDGTFSYFYGTKSNP